MNKSLQHRGRGVRISKSLLRQAQDQLRTSNMFSKQKAVIFLTVLINAIGIGIVIPVLPFYAESFGASAFGVTALLAVYSLCSFFSAPFLGSLADRYGRRPILIISILSTSLGWFVFATAKHLPLLFLGRVIDGMAAGNFSTAQSYLIDISSNKKEKTQNLGLVSVAFGLGLVLGPTFGGFLSPVSPSFPFWFVAFLSLFNGILAIFLIPETNFRASLKKLQEKVNWNPFLPIIKAFKNKLQHLSFLTWFLFESASMSLQAIIPLYMAYTFGFGAVAVGVLLTCVGLMVILNQIAFLKHFWLKYFSENDLKFWLFLSLAVGYVILAVPKLLWFIIAAVIITFCTAVLRVVIASDVSSKGQPSQQGELMGTLSSLGAVATIIAPPVAGAVFQINPTSPLYLCAAYSFVAFLIVLLPQKIYVSKPTNSK